MFNKFIADRPDLLDDYPILKMEYKAFNNKVMSKTEEELYFSMVDEIDYSKLSYEQVMGQIDIYRELINNVKCKTKSKRKK